MRGFGEDNVEEDSRGDRRHLVALLRRRIGADEGRRSGGPESMQARYCALLQPGPARPRPDQGVHEGAPARTLRTVQRRALPSLAAPVSLCAEKGGEGQTTAI